MIRAIRLLLHCAFLGSLLVPLLGVFASVSNTGAELPPGAALKLAIYALVGLFAFAGFYYLLRQLEPYLVREAVVEAAYVDGIAESYLPIAILTSAGLSLFLELSVIRWQASVLEFFAFYKNYGLLSCFAGLGLGYALSRRTKEIPLNLTLPLLGWQFALLYLLRYGLPVRSLRSIPFTEQLTMGVIAAKPFQMVAIYALLAVIFLLTALTFLPVGQLCGRLMERKSQLSAYGWNLLGSLLGVLLMFFVSFLWTPPVVWFGICSLLILFFIVRSPQSLLVSASFATLVTVLLAWPVNPYWNRVYSPYQLLEIGTGENGLMTIRAAGTYYQRVYNLSVQATEASRNPQQLQTKNYYELPYRLLPEPGEVAIVGAGSGNDVAAALRARARHVDAIEIDPAILQAGKLNHPEKPYDDPRVQAIVNDARSFFRNATKRYDTIAYGLLDSHTLLSHASSVRLDSFVYTVEGLREARSRLKENGVLSISFAVLNDALGTKLYRMMTEAFDGREPVCIFTDGSTVFIESANGKLSVPPALLSEFGFSEKSSFYRDSAIPVDISTDDWPFLYMPRRIYPVSYLLMVALILVLSAVLSLCFLEERPQFSDIPFFFLGAGFMLVETKAITEMGLTFGNTWQVIAIAIASVLVMAFLANAVVAWLHIRTTHFAYIFLIFSLALGLWVASRGGLASTTLGRIGTVFVLSCPLFFSGVVFSVLLAAGSRISSAMSLNLLGAMCGGILEYNSMYFGFRFLYVLAMFLYVFAFLSRVPLLSSASVPAANRRI